MSTLFYPIITFILIAICISYWAVTAVYPSFSQKLYAPQMFSCTQVCCFSTKPEEQQELSLLLKKLKYMGKRKIPCTSRGAGFAAVFSFNVCILLYWNVKRNQYEYCMACGDNAKRSLQNPPSIRILSSCSALITTEIHSLLPRHPNSLAEYLARPGYAVLLMNWVYNL